MKFFFEVESGLIERSKVRRELLDARDKIMHFYPKCKITIGEKKELLKSNFYFDATNLPISAKDEMKIWATKLNGYNTLIS